MQRCTGEGGKGGARAGPQTSSVAAAAAARVEEAAAAILADCGFLPDTPSPTVTAGGAKPSGKCSPQLGLG